MKAITRSTIYLPIAAMILTAALALPAAAQNQVTFKGTIQGQDTSSPPKLMTDATGVATHLGQFSFTQEVTVNFANLTDTGSAHFIAANGDSIDTTVVGTAEFPPDTPGFLKATEFHVITAGTGRFAGAHGSFTVTRLHNTTTLFTSGSFSGKITTPAAAH